MKLLICAQKVDINDDLLGFFHSWIVEFAKNCEQVTVICLYKGKYDLPDNVRVLSLGKEKRNQESGIRNQGITKLLNCFIVRLLYFFRFYKYIFKYRKDYDSVFVHMNSVYILLGGFFWRMWRNKVGLWYAHGHVPWELRVAEKFVDNIFTSTVSGCRMNSEKIRIVGQGIDVNKFQIKSKSTNPNFAKATQGKHKSKINLITIGRISPVKDIKTLINAADILVKKGINIKLDIIGQIGLVEQQKYYEFLRELIKEKKLEDNISFVGAVPNKSIVKYLQNSDIFVSASQTGSLDKTFLEAMACGLPVIGCNKALLAVLGKYEKDLFYAIEDSQGLSERIKSVIDLGEDDYIRMGEYLRGVVVKKHGLEGFVGRILGILK